MFFQVKYNIIMKFKKKIKIFKMTNLFITGILNNQSDQVFLLGQVYFKNKQKIKYLRNNKLIYSIPEDNILNLENIIRKIFYIRYNLKFN